MWARWVQGQWAEGAAHVAQKSTMKRALRTTEVCTKFPGYTDTHTSLWTKQAHHFHTERHCMHSPTHNKGDIQRSRAFHLQSTPAVSFCVCAVGKNKWQRTRPHDQLQVHKIFSIRLSKKLCKTIRKKKNFQRENKNLFYYTFWVVMPFWESFWGGHRRGDLIPKKIKCLDAAGGRSAKGK